MSRVRKVKIARRLLFPGTKLTLIINKTPFCCFFFFYEDASGETSRFWPERDRHACVKSILAGRVPFPIPRLRLDLRAFRLYYSRLLARLGPALGPLCRVTIRLVALRQVHRSVVPPLAAAAALFVHVAADLCASKTIQRAQRVPLALHRDTYLCLVNVTGAMTKRLENGRRN